MHWLLLLSRVQAHSSSLTACCRTSVARAAAATAAARATAHLTSTTPSNMHTAALAAHSDAGIGFASRAGARLPPQLSGSSTMGGCAGTGGDNYGRIWLLPLRRMAAPHATGHSTTAAHAYGAWQACSSAACSRSRLHCRCGSVGIVTAGRSALPGGASPSIPPQPPASAHLAGAALCRTTSMCTTSGACSSLVLPGGLDLPRGRGRACSGGGAVRATCAAAGADRPVAAASSTNDSDAAEHNPSGGGAGADGRCSSGVIGTSSCSTSSDDGSGASVSSRSNISSAATSAEEISRRIAESRRRRSELRFMHCPACAIAVATAPNLVRHMERCCPDLLGVDPKGWGQCEQLPRGESQRAAAEALAEGAAQQEAQLQQEALRLTFRSGLVGSGGAPLRMELVQLAGELGLPLERTAGLLQRAMAAVPLVADDEPLDVVYEDEDFLAVNKPYGVQSAPVHRFMGGSMVNRAIGHLRRQRQGRAAAEQLTLLSAPGLGLVPGPVEAAAAASRTAMTLEAAADAAVAAVGLAAARRRAARMLAGGSSGSGSDADGVDPDHPGSDEPFVLHRLDMNTSGLLLFAKRQEVVAGIHRQFRERTLSKFYVAAAVGCPPWERHDVDAPIDRHPAVDVARMVGPAGKEASTSFGLIARNPDADLSPAAGATPGILYGNAPPGDRAALQQQQQQQQQQPLPAGLRGAALLLCAPHSGRTHQIRVHLQAAGYPIVGDDIYGIMGPWIGRQALHAAALCFVHPLTGRAMRLDAPLHEDMTLCLRQLGLPPPDTATLHEAWAELGVAGAAAAGAAAAKRRKGRGRSKHGG